MRAHGWRCRVVSLHPREGPLLAAGVAREIVEWARRFREADLPYMVVGAFAVAVHGMVRTTHDIDFVIHLPFHERGRVEEVLRRHGLTDIEERVDPQWGQRLAARLESELILELFFTPRNIVFDREYDRRVTVTLDGEEVCVMSAEDLVLRKLVNMRLRRGHDYDDILTVLAVQGDAFDHAYIRDHCGLYRVCEMFDRAVKEAELLAGGDE